MRAAGRGLRVVKGALARSSMATTGVLALRVATQALTLVLVTRLLGPTTYGDYMAAASLAVVLGLIPNLGSGYVLMARAARDGKAAIENWRYGWPLSVSIGGALALVFPFLARTVTHGSLSLVDLGLIGASELLATPLTLLLSFVLQARHRVPQGQLLLWIPMALRAAAAAICFVFFSRTPVHLFVVLQSTAALAGLVLALMMTNRVARLPWKPRRPSREEWRSGAAYAAMHVVAANPTELDKIISPVLLGAHTAGIYSATSRIMNAVVMPVVGMLSASQPRLFRHGATPTHEGRRLVGLLGRISFGWGLLSAAALALGAPLLPYLLGEAFAETATTLPWVAMAAPFMALRMAAGTVLVAAGHPLRRLRFELTGILLLAVLLGLGARFFDVRGMAIGLTLGEAFMATYGWHLVRRAQAISTPLAV
jgi:O-antigen/teichoic acid export membrane protein